jgi:acyl-[acyl-carrier-protein]-phospholipid O-acyltransferase/long-chain-fatty-acid--[acyl-carrier-protein] ligase
MFATLMKARRFAPLFWCQFLSAFNDNFLKNALVFLILFKLSGENSEALISLAGAIFIFPFFVLSALGGEMADKHDKARVAQILKLIEIAVAGLAIAGFWMHSVPILFLALFLFGVISALFGPIKYGILPDHLATAELPAGNALIEGATFLAILTGTIAGGLAAKDGGDPAHFAGLMIVFAVGCWIAALFIPPTGRGDPGLRINPNILSSTWRLLREIKGNGRLWWGAMVVSWFWLVGAAMLSLLPLLVKNTLGGNEEVVTAFLAIFSVTIALGSALASYIAAGRIILKPTLVGAILIGLSALDLSYATYGVHADASGLGIRDVFTSRHGIHVMIDLALLAIAGGLYVVPAFSAVQSWAGHERRARVVAAVNILNAAFMVAVGVILALLLKAGTPLSVLFLLIGIATLAVSIAIARTMPALSPPSELDAAARQPGPAW